MKLMRERRISWRFEGQLCRYEFFWMAIDPVGKGLEEARESCSICRSKRLNVLRTLFCDLSFVGEDMLKAGAPPSMKKSCFRTEMGGNVIHLMLDGLEAPIDRRRAFVNA